MESKRRKFISISFSSVGKYRKLGCTAIVCRRLRWWWSENTQLFIHSGEFHNESKCIISFNNKGHRDIQNILYKQYSGKVIPPPPTVLTPPFPLVLISKPLWVVILQVR